ncbi:MAG TPA: hypothetical protein VGM56_17655 [Byssovorax sp.]
MRAPSVWFTSFALLALPLLACGSDASVGTQSSSSTGEGAGSSTSPSSSTSATQSGPGSTSSSGAGAGSAGGGQPSASSVATTGSSATGGAGGESATGVGGAGAGVGGAGVGGAAASTTGTATTSTTSTGNPTCDLSPILGSWTVATYACGSGAQTALPPGFHFDFTATGDPANPDATFTQDNFGMCTFTTQGTVACDGMFDSLPALAITWGGAESCNPPNCLGNSQCSAAQPQIFYTYQLASVNGHEQLTTVTLPNTPLTTCTSQGLPNPITFVWVQH